MKRLFSILAVLLFAQVGNAVTVIPPPATNTILYVTGIKVTPTYTEVMAGIKVPLTITRCWSNNKIEILDEYSIVYDYEEGQISNKIYLNSKVGRNIITIYDNNYGMSTQATIDIKPNVLSRIEVIPVQSTMKYGIKYEDVNKLFAVRAYDRYDNPIINDNIGKPIYNIKRNESAQINEKVGTITIPGFNQLLSAGVITENNAILFFDSGTYTVTGIATQTTILVMKAAEFQVKYDKYEDVKGWEDYNIISNSINIDSGS